MFTKAEAQLGIEPAVGAIEGELVMVSVCVRQEPGRLQRDSGDRIGFGDVPGEADRIGSRLWRRGTEVIHIGVAEGVDDGGIWMRLAEPRIVEKHKPYVRAESLLVRKLAQDVLAGHNHRMRNRFDRAVPLRIRGEVNDAVLWKIHLSRFAMRTQEFARMIAPRNCHGVEPQRAEAVERGGRPDFGEVPSIGIDGPVAHPHPR